MEILISKVYQYKSGIYVEASIFFLSNFLNEYTLCFSYNLWQATDGKLLIAPNSEAVVKTNRWDICLKHKEFD
jgi:hypothetical protein